MKKDIHPVYKEADITCACGNVIKTRSTSGHINIEICSVCHPFFTGKQKLIDTAGRVDKFKARMEKAKAFQEAKKQPAKKVVETEKPKDKNEK